MDGEAWQAAVHGVTQNWTRLKQLSSSSSIVHIGPTKDFQKNIEPTLKTILEKNYNIVFEMAA